MAIDVSKVSYRLKILLPNGREITVDELVNELKLEENENEMSARLRVNMKNIKLSDGWIHQHVYLAKRLALFATDGNGWEEVFRGSIFKWVYEGKDSTIEFTAYDPLYTMMKSKRHYYCRKGETGSTTIRRVAGNWPGISIGTVEGPNVGLAQKPYTSGTIGDMFAERLEESRKKGSGRYVIRDVKGKLNCLRVGSNRRVFILEGKVVESAADEHSIEDLMTRVRVYGTDDKNETAKVEATREGRTEFGIIQDIVYSSSYDSLAEARKAADEILKEKGKPEIVRTIIAPDIPWIRKGDRVEISAGSIGKVVNGKYEPLPCVVKSISRDWATGKMTMTLRGGE